VGLKDDRREDLDPVCDELAVARRAQLARLGVGAQPPRSLAGDQGRLAVARPGSHRHERLGDPPRDELVVASGVRSLVHTHGSLAALAGVVPSLLARQELGEAMRSVAVGRDAAVELATVVRLAVVAVEAHPRPRMLGVRAGRSCLAPRPPWRRHVGDEAKGRAGQNAQLEATGGRV